MRIDVCVDCHLSHHGYDEHELGHTFDVPVWGRWAEDGTPRQIADVSDGESHFSYSTCEGCGSTLGGNRYIYDVAEMVSNVRRGDVP